MSSKKCCLRQHIRGEPANLILIDLSLDDSLLKYALRGPNQLGSHIEEAFQLLDIDDIDNTPESGSSAILHTQNAFAFLEALTSDVRVESLGRSFDGVSAHTGMKVRPSISGNIPSVLQLLPGQSFYIGKTTLSLVPEEHSDLPLNSSGLPDSNFESYNYQVSQISTPQRTARVGSTVMETPNSHRDPGSEYLTPIIEQVTQQAISGRKDSKHWPETPLKQDVLRIVRDASENGNSDSKRKPKSEDEHSANAAITEPDRSSSQPKVKAKDEGLANASVVRPVGQDDDLDDTPVRKKAKTGAVSIEALVEDSQDSLLNEVISVRRDILTPTSRPVSADHALSTVLAPSIKTDSRSGAANHSKQKPSTPSAASKHQSHAIDSDSRSHPANQPQSESSFNSTGPISRTRLSKPSPTSASPFHSIEPNSSMRSTRSTARDKHDSSSIADAEKRIVFASSSSVGESKPCLKFLSTKGVKEVQSVHDCTILCVGKELKKTSKLILAVMLGKDIIADNWVIDSVKHKDLLSVVPYIARDLEREAEWGISLDEAIYRGKRGVKVLQDQTIMFTPSAKKELGKISFDELKEIVKFAGAKAVSSALPKKGPEKTSCTVIIGTHDSTEVAALQQLGWRAYVNDIISLSILRGKLDLESEEFLIKEGKRGTRKRKR